MKNFITTGLFGIALWASHSKAQDFELNRASPAIFASSPASYGNMARNGIVSKVQDCGFQILDGRDPRLPNSVLSRNVQQVIAKVDDNNKVEPHVLIDLMNGFGQDRYATVFMKKNGGQIIQIEVDTDFDDVAFQTDHGGRLAYTTSSRTNHAIETVWRVRGSQGGMKRVSEQDFSKYVTEKIVDVWSDRICKNKYRP